MNRWQLDHIKPADLEPILAIEKNSFKWPWGRLSFEGELRIKSSCNFVAKSTEEPTEGQIIAYAIWRLLADEMHILKVAVIPDRRGQGIATRLLERCFAWSVEQGAVSAHLEVRPSNVAAVELYRKLGFEVVGRRPKYYTDTKEDALLMAKDISGMRQ